MFTQFRASYPTGCLISELVTIYHGQYIVRSLVQVDGMTKSSGLAAADTLEKAEDQARIRALMILGLDHVIAASPVTPASPTEVKTSIPTARGTIKEPLIPETPPVAQGAKPVTVGTVHGSLISETSTAAKDQPVTVGTVSESLTSGTPTAKGQSVAAGTVNEPPIISMTTLHGDIPALHKSWSPEKPDPLTTQAVPPPPEPESPVSEPLELPISPAIAAERPEKELDSDDWLDAKYGVSDFEQKTSPDFPEPSALTTEPPLTPVGVMTAASNLETYPISSMGNEMSFEMPISTESQDLSDELVDIKLLLEKLKWTEKQQKNYLLQTYGKLSLDLLSEDELIEFHNCLDLFDKTDAEIKRLQWGSKQGSSFLEQTYGKKSRHHLSPEELLDFFHRLAEMPN